MCLLCFLWLTLSRDGEGVVAQCLVQFYFLHAVLREECALRHLEALREVERYQHSVNFLELVVRSSERKSVVIYKKLHDSSGRRVDVEISRIVFRIGYTKTAQLLLVSYRRNFIPGLIKLTQHVQPK